MLLKRAKARRPFFHKTIGSYHFFYSNWKQFQFFKIAKFEFKVTVHYGLWKKGPSFDPLKDVCVYNHFSQLHTETYWKILLYFKRRQRLFLLSISSIFSTIFLSFILHLSFMFYKNCILNMLNAQSSNIWNGSENKTSNSVFWGSKTSIFRW